MNVPTGILQIEDNCFFNNNCSINCLKNIYIGANSIFGENVLFYDHDHKFSKNLGAQTPGFISENIHIGKNCWIGAGVIILKGTVIGDNSVVAAGTIVKGKYPDNSLIYNSQK